ncbi:hypothetical protein LCGC14_2864780 [marine sediment metagenome]|uniref:Uncharacterized protein n=1 Tax=marine sediment metagenome TaxID=412755 RepID=A0A0F9ACV9_9ZZZZ
MALPPSSLKGSTFITDKLKIYGVSAAKLSEALKKIGVSSEQATKNLAKFGVSPNLKELIKEYEQRAIKSKKRFKRFIKLRTWFVRWRHKIFR